MNSIYEIITSPQWKSDNDFEENFKLIESFLPKESKNVIKSKYLDISNDLPRSDPDRIFRLMIKYSHVNVEKFYPSISYDTIIWFVDTGYYCSIILHELAKRLISLDEDEGKKMVNNIPWYNFKDNDTIIDLFSYAIPLPEFLKWCMSIRG